MLATWYYCVCVGGVQLDQQWIWESWCANTCNSQQGDESGAEDLRGLQEC